MNTFPPNDSNETVTPSRFPEPEPIMVPGQQIPGPDVLDYPSEPGPDCHIVSAYSRLDYDYWQTRLRRAIPNGMFGEHFTTHGIDLCHARIGERWRIGPRLVLEITGPRMPSGRFLEWLRERGWLETFIAAERPGVFARVVAPGPAQAGDKITVQSRPDHDVTVWDSFRALTSEDSFLPTLLRMPQLPRQAVRLLRQHAPHGDADAVST